ncbi:protein of unknown function DUF211 (plasmid) [Haloterrigena turkmenica DSM 5511]|uniref:DUF211 domain-containing protein n=1 Tax=Haloterrigena turkmenica (strain ATCC 51198 / DSM 5511 / JCM 9101 / NCIMB 13204 / VKM B-1734 / 4k) TaxID=543526 RepID=D2S142_HALTV|nr:DUF211 domain-containing protein [Haloterrigena turkmenica]ADB63089.1 protein of unknown function DUF211 [Haloterrigena turkmenica DSM 5511]
MSPPIRRLVLDVMKPQEPNILEFADVTADCPGADGVNVVLVETDREVQNLKLTIEGDGIDADALEQAITDLGGTIHSIDQVVCGEHLVEQIDTPQDR